MSARDPTQVPARKATEPQTEQPARFSPEEEAALVEESQAQKAQANALFASEDYSQAVGEYDKALSSCPNYLEFEVAVLRSNIAACHLKLSEWNAAVEAATAALDALDRLLPTPKPSSADEKHVDSEDTESKGRVADGDSHQVVELDDDPSTNEEAQLTALALSDQRKLNIRRIRAKALMRRARAKSELGGWANLQAAEEDYKALLAGNSNATTSAEQQSQSLRDVLSALDLKTVQTALRSLQPRVKAAQEKEMGEMWGKLKDLGNGILKPFGMSTDNFQMVKDEKTGGYSMNFKQNGG